MLRVAAAMAFASLGLLLTACDGDDNASPVPLLDAGLSDAAKDAARDGSSDGARDAANSASDASTDATSTDAAGSDAAEE